jgi:hypothetical protein
VQDDRLLLRGEWAQRNEGVVFHSFLGFRIRVCRQKRKKKKKMKKNFH